eukprot:Sdes_comp13159_c0_seq1m3071
MRLIVGIQRIHQRLERIRHHSFAFPTQRLAPFLHSSPNLLIPKVKRLLLRSLANPHLNHNHFFILDFAFGNILLLLINPHFFVNPRPSTTFGPVFFLFPQTGRVFLGLFLHLVKFPRIGKPIGRKVHRRQPNFHQRNIQIHAIHPKRAHKVPVLVHRLHINLHISLKHSLIRIIISLLPKRLPALFHPARGNPANTWTQNPPQQKGDHTRILGKMNLESGSGTHKLNNPHNFTGSFEERKKLLRFRRIIRNVGNPVSPTAASAPSSASMKPLLGLNRATLRHQQIIINGRSLFIVRTVTHDRGKPFGYEGLPDIDGLNTHGSANLFWIPFGGFLHVIGPNRNFFANQAFAKKFTGFKIKRDRIQRPF